MPAPTGNQIYNEILSQISSVPKSADLTQYLSQLADAISQAWDTWSLGLKWGGLTVTGAGIGAWAGVGSVGAILEPSVINILTFSFQKDTDEHKAFVRGLATAIKPEFSKWVSSYKFASLPYFGASTATPITPGVFTAFPNQTPLQTCGTGVPPLASIISQSWKDQLRSSGFNLDADGVTTPQIVDGVANAIVQAFTSTYLLNSVVSGSIAIGVSSPPAGAGSGSSTLAGTIA